MHLNTHSASDGGLDFELNLAPIIDCLTVLITFTLISASFLSVTVLDAGLPGQASTSTQAPPVSLELHLRKNAMLELSVRGEVNEVRQFPAQSGGDWDLASVRSRLEELKQRWPSVQGVSVLSEEEIDYKSIVRVMESARDLYPAVALGGI